MGAQKPDTWTRHGGRRELKLNSDIFDSGSRVRLQLAPALAKEVFNSGKVPPIDHDVLIELGSMKIVSTYSSYHSFTHPSIYTQDWTSPGA